MKIQEIRELIKLIDQSSIDEFEYENDGAKITMKKGKQANEQVADVPPFEEGKVTYAKSAEANPNVKNESKTMDASNKETNDTAVKKETEIPDDLHKVESPMVGTFYSSSSPDADPYVKAGDKVEQNTVVCIVEAMKLFNEIEAEINGEIVEILADNGELVEYGQPLFLVKP